MRALLDWLDTSWVGGDPSLSQVPYLGAKSGRTMNPVETPPAATRSRRKHPPRLVLGPLTGRIYIATRYRERDGGIIETQEKYDVTNDFLALYEEATSKFTYTEKGGGKQHG